MLSLFKVLSLWGGWFWPISNLRASDFFRRMCFRIPLERRFFFRFAFLFFVCIINHGVAPSSIKLLDTFPQPTYNSVTWRKWKPVMASVIASGKNWGQQTGSKREAANSERAQPRECTIDKWSVPKPGCIVGRGETGPLASGISAK
jgi:hypothetical protein